MPDDNFDMFPIDDQSDYEVDWETGEPEPEDDPWLLDPGFDEEL